MAALLRSVGFDRVESAETLEAAVARADALARETLPGAGPDAVATVLLSPAAASFDMFVDYTARGRAFKAAVAAITAGRVEGRTP